MRLHRKGYVSPIRMLARWTNDARLFGRDRRMLYLVFASLFETDERKQYTDLGAKRSPLRKGIRQLEREAANYLIESKVILLRSEISAEAKDCLYDRINSYHDSRKLMFEGQHFKQVHKMLDPDCDK